MAVRAVAISPSHGGFPPQGWNASRLGRRSNYRVSAKAAASGEEREDGGGKERKKSLFSSVTEALDFSQVRSSRDAELLEDARQATRSGGRMTREQWMGNMLKKGGWTRHARFARRTQGERQDKLTNLEHMSMLLVWRIPTLPLAISSPSSSPNENN